MSDLGGDERRRGRKKVPFTKRRKHPVIDNPASLNGLSDEVLAKLMCTLDIKTLFKIAALNKRVNAIFRTPWFFKQCIAPYLSSMQRIAALVKGHSITFNHDTKNNLDVHTMHANGVTVDGVIYDVEWAIDVHGYADSLYDDYTPDDADDYDGNVPVDDDERLQWFREEFDGGEDHVQGAAVFDFPSELKEVKFVRERVRDILSYFTRKFSKYIVDEGATGAGEGGGGEDQWYIKVEVRPFKVLVTADTVSGDAVGESVSKEMERTYKSKLKEERQSPEMQKKGPSAYLKTHISYTSKELERTLEQVQRYPRERSDMKCKTAVEEARELLEQVRSGTYDEETLDKINSTNARLLECIEV